MIVKFYGSKDRGGLSFEVSLNLDFPEVGSALSQHPCQVKEMNRVIKQQSSGLALISHPSSFVHVHRRAVKMHACLSEFTGVSPCQIAQSPLDIWFETIVVDDVASFPVQTGVKLRKLGLANCKWLFKEYFVYV